MKDLGKLSHFLGIDFEQGDVEPDVDRVGLFRLTLKFFDDVSTAS